jgi:hypothetical protein
MIEELKNPITEEYLKLKKIILDEKRFPWYFVSPHSSGNEQDFWFYSHTILNRGNPPVITSPKFFDICNLVLQQIFKENNIFLKNFHRINVNSTHYLPHNHNIPHVDHIHSHKNMLIYLNRNISGNTIIFDETSSENNFCHSINDKNKILKIKKEIIPEEDKIITFDGDYYHCHRFPKPSEKRIVLVCTYSTS